MERGCHINVAMLDDLGVNGLVGSKVAMVTEPVAAGEQLCGSTVSFHQVGYKVHVKDGFFCKKKSSPRQILLDLKLVLFF